MKKEYLITYRINNRQQRNSFELLMEVGFKEVRKKRYKIVKYYEIKSDDDAKEMERKIRLIANEIIWGKDDSLEILNLNLKHEKNSLRFTDEERIIIKGNAILEDEIIKWIEFMFLLKQVEDNYFKNVNK
jgi:hypothetical protein